MAPLPAGPRQNRGVFPYCRSFRTALSCFQANGLRSDADEPMPTDTPRTTWLNRLARLGWLLLLVAHVPAGFSAWGLRDAAGDVQPLKALLITLSLAFFVLKVLDVRILRIRPEPRAVLALLVGVALLHAGVGTHDHDPALVEPTPWQAVLLAGGLAALGAASGRWGVVIAAFSPRELAAGFRAAWHALCQSLLAALLPPRYALLVIPASSLRAPPAR